MSQFDLILGDCLEIMPTLESKSIDMILCDLPYGTTACAWDTVIPFEPLWTQYKRLIKPQGAIVLFGSQPFTSALVMSNPGGFKYCWVWEKNNATGFSHCANMPLKSHEDIAVFSAGIIQHKHLSQQRMNYNPQGLQRHGEMNKRGCKGFAGTMERISQSNTYRTEFTGYPRMIIRFDGETGTVHPTQKPVDLLAYLIKTYTNPGDLVLDNCMGSGSTGCACRLNHRRFIGIEKDPDYFAIAQKRIAETQPPAITDEGVFIQPEQTSMFASA